MTSNNNTIFVSIASYKDPELINTIDDLLDKAEHPSNIRVVVLNQTDGSQDLSKYDNVENVEIYSIYYKKTKGVSWVRNLIQKFITNEEYYLQIDAHMRFGEKWDTKLKRYLKECNSSKPIISFYPSGYDLKKGKYQSDILKNEIRGFNMKGVKGMAIGMNKELCALENGDDKPILGSTGAAGFLFSYSQYVKECPYDPKLYWNYEEPDITLRAFTNGWDFFGIPECLIWHKYNITQSSPSHYTEIKGSNNRENRSNTHAEAKYFNKDYQTDYPLGKVRTLEEYNILNNVDIEKGKKYDILNKDVLIVVPYRDREQHLKDFLEKTPKYFNDRNISYDIIICELDNIGDWNAGLVCNSMINFRKKANYKYIYIHHVDVYPISGEWKFPKDDEVYKCLGDVGSCITTMANFLKVGGYRNDFWGWGAEDDDLYMRLHRAGVRVLDVTKDVPNYPVKFDDKYQTHVRPFNSKNYNHNSQLLYKKFDRNYRSVFDVNHYSTTHSLRKLKDNVYIQNILPKTKSPSDIKPKNLVMSCMGALLLKDCHTFLKSVTYFAPNNYDIVVIDYDEHESDLARELKNFGVKVVKRKKREDIFIDRWKDYADYYNKSEYDQVLCVDLSDIHFTDNPFKIIKNSFERDKDIVMTSEGVIISDEKWNRDKTKLIYGDTVYEGIKDYEIQNGGVMAFRGDGLKKFSNLVIREYNSLTKEQKDNNGIDQIIINKLCYYDQAIQRVVLRDDSALVAHLHAKYSSKNKGRFHIQEAGVNFKNADGKVYSIIHQFNRNKKLFKKLNDHYKTAPYPIR